MCTTAIVNDLEILENEPIPTWFHVGGRADRLVNVRDQADLARAIALDPSARVLGDGANLLVDDGGVGELVIATKRMNRVRIESKSGKVWAEAGADLPKLIVATVREGLAGLEGLGGVPATVGGATIMNAGGKFGEIADSITAVHVVDRSGRERVLSRSEIQFSYRHSGLAPFLVTAVEFQLQPSDQPSLRKRLLEVMEYKKHSQPMKDKSAGCCFKNPTLTTALSDSRGPIGEAGARVSAGMLIDRAGLKTLAIGGASVNERHGNFLVTTEGATAGDVIRLMEEVERRVFDRFGVVLEREVVVWSRG